MYSMGSHGFVAAIDTAAPLLVRGFGFSHSSVQFDLPCDSSAYTRTPTSGTCVFIDLVHGSSNIYSPFSLAVLLLFLTPSCPITFDPFFSLHVHIV